MIRICIPFLLTDSSQIPRHEFVGARVSSEANIFDGIKLKELIDSGQFDLLLKKTSKISDIGAFHFPTENANYFESEKLFNVLIDSIKIIGNNNIVNFVLHSNLIQPLDRFNYSDMPRIRGKFIEKYKHIDEIAKNVNVTVCIENLPAIGNNGDDFDSVFVFPEDFIDLNFKNVKVAWDIGHWAYTCKVFSKLSGYINLETDSVPEFEDFLKISDKISRFHFSSFLNKDDGRGMPICEEGIIPQLGDFDQNKLSNICRTIHLWEKKIDMTLEIKEKNYTKRKNSALVVDWFNSNVFV